MVRQSERHRANQFTIVGSMCMCDAPIVERGVCYAKLYHTLLWPRDLMEGNMYSRSYQTDKVTKQWETCAGSRHHAKH